MANAEKTRKRTHVVLIALLPAAAQIGGFFFIANWAQGAGSGGGMIGLYALLILAVAVPVTMIINIVVATFSQGLPFFWMLLIALAIAMLLPILGGLALLTQ